MGRHAIGVGLRWALQASKDTSIRDVGLWDLRFVVVVVEDEETVRAEGARVELEDA